MTTLDALIIAMREALAAERERALIDFATAIDGLRREVADLRAARNGWEARAREAEKALEAKRDETHDNGVGK